MSGKLHLHNYGLEMGNKELRPLYLKEEVFRIVGAAMEVHRIVGPGFLEAVYQECLVREFRARSIPFLEQPRLVLEYKGRALERGYIPDFLVFQEIVLELKAKSQCTGVDKAQVINAALMARKDLGLLINFGESSLFWKRFACRPIPLV